MTYLLWPQQTNYQTRTSNRTNTNVTKYRWSWWTNTGSNTLTTLHLTDGLFTCATLKTQWTNFNFKQNQHKNWQTLIIYGRPYVPRGLKRIGEGELYIILIETTQHLIQTTAYMWQLTYYDLNKPSKHLCLTPTSTSWFMCINKLIKDIFSQKNYQHFSVELRDCHWHYAQVITDYCPVSCSKTWQSTETAQATNLSQTMVLLYVDVCATIVQTSAFPETNPL